MTPKILVLGADGVNWAMDKDVRYLVKVLEDLGYPVSRRFLTSKIIYSVWWNKFLSLPARCFTLKRLLRKKFIATIPNDLAHQVDSLRSIIPSVDHWVYFNGKQKKVLIENGVAEDSMSYNPPYFDETIFWRLETPREELAKECGVDFEKLRSRFVIGSFQRDSLGDDLTKAKWQKNPDMLLDIFSHLDKEKYILLLAGPRRHYLINRCRELGVPFYYLGDMNPVDQGVDDLTVNVLPLETMNLLYNLVDLYVVGSKSEGTPYAIIETCLSRTAVISTDVGVASEFLDPWCIYSDGAEGAAKIVEISGRPDLREQILEDNYRTGIRLNNYDAYRARVAGILEKVI